MSLEEVVSNLAKEIKKIEGKTMKGLIRAAIPVVGEAVEGAPMVTGNLRASKYVITSRGKVEQGRNPEFKGKQAAKMARAHSRTLSDRRSVVGQATKSTVEIGFSAEYALKVHENRRAGKTGMLGASEVGHWKFLEWALRDNQKRILSIIREEARIK